VNDKPPPQTVPAKRDGFTVLRDVLSSIPLPVLALLGGQALTFLLWIIRLEDRVSLLNRQVTSIEMRMALMDVRDTRAGILVAERVGQLELRVALLVSAMTGIPPLMVPPVAPSAPAPAPPPP
jgi:hypothetical protein